MKNGIHNVGFRLRNKSVFLACQVKNGFRDRLTLLHDMHVIPGMTLLLLCILALIMLAVGKTMIASGVAFAMVANVFTKEQTDELGTLLGKVGEKHKETIKAEVQDAIKATGFDKDLGAKLTRELGDKLEALGLKADVIKTLQEVAEKQGDELRRLGAIGGENKNGKTVEQLIEEKAADIAKLKDCTNSSGNLKLIIPAGTPLVKTQVVRSAVSGSTMAMRLTDVGQLPYLGMKMTNIFRHATADESSAGVIRFYDQAAITRAAASTAEAAAAPESVISWIERLIKIEKVTDSIPVTKEAWRQIYFIQSEIDRLLNINLALKEDNLLWSGDGATPNITGVYTTATAVNIAARVADVSIKAVQFANIYDLIASMRVLIMNSKQSKYLPNVVVMNPADILAYKLTKNSFGQYVIPSFVTADGTTIDGCSVVESSQVTVNTLLVGDSRYGTIYDLGGIEIEMGYINDQLVKGAMTIMATKFETLLIRNVDADGFLKCTDIDAAVAQLTIA
jgi:hypothetical protein